MYVCPVVLDGDYMVSPITEVLLMQRVAFPPTIAMVTNNRMHFPSLNFGFSPEALPRGISLAVLFPLSSFEVSPLTSDGPAGLATSVLESDEVTCMIALDLSQTHAQELSHPLASYRNIFYFGL